MSEAPYSTLYLLRHGHSSVAEPGQRDHERPLDERGRDDASKIGADFARSGYRLDAVVCSTAVRAEQTFAAIRSYLPDGIRAQSSAELYDLGAEAYLAKARECGSVGSLMLIGHNPMIETFAMQLIADKGTPAALALREGFPTAGLAVIEFPVGLSEIAPGSGDLRRLLRPRELG